jgi:cytochrome c nitrite reductase small subunit
MRKVINTVLPPPEWRGAVIIVLGVLVGLGLAIFHIANGTSYLSDNPRACINCHVMTTEYASWERSSHARVASCNDCHVPQDNFVRMYAFKASDGMRHAFMFTFRLEPQVIQIKEAGANVVQENCIRCHTHQVHRTNLREDVTLSLREETGAKFCWDCHRETPHGRTRSLSAYPHARIPQVQPAIPAWLERVLER